jgi:cation:H+ antiporter
MIWTLLLLAGGLALLWKGADLLSDGTAGLAQRMGVSQLVIGLSDAVIGSTILAIGTTLPELMTCLVAAIKGHHNISIGNLVGSVVFNSLFVKGIAALARPLVISPRFAGGPDYWILVGVAVGFTTAVILGKRTIRRLSGFILLLAYAGYLAYLLRFTPAG